MRYRRKRFFRFRIKKNTVNNIFAVLLVSAGILIIISLFQTGTSLDILKNKTYEIFGWGIYIFPLILFSLSFLFLKIKIIFAKPNVVVGLLLSFICSIAITKAGLIGSQIWDNFSVLVSPVGSFVILSGMFFIGLMVLFNTSIDEIVKTLSIIIKKFNKFSFPLSKIDFSQKNTRPVFVEKPPIKPPTSYKEEENSEKSTMKRDSSSVLPTISTGLIANMPGQNQNLWEYPQLSLLSSSMGQKADRGDMKQHAHIIEKTLESFGISARVTEVNLGPAVTQYALEIAMGTKLSKITALSNDLALALAAPTGQIRIEAPIPGRNLVGIEVPNRSLEFVTLRHMLSSETLKRNKDKLLVALGLDVSGNPVTANIAKMPHVLIAGTTGSGKSVLINSWITSILFRTNPN